MQLLPLSFYLPKIQDFVEVFSIGCEKIEDKFFVRIACRNGSGDIVLIQGYFILKERIKW